MENQVLAQGSEEGAVVGPSPWNIQVQGPTPRPAWLDQVLAVPGQVATAQFDDDPYIKLRRKLAADRKAALDRRRAADDAVLPTIIQDYKDSSARADAIMQRIDVAMGALNAPPPQMGPPQMNEGENLTGALTALFAPESLNQVLGALGQASQQRSDVEMENTLRAYGLTRETAKMAVQQLLGRLDREYGVMDTARRTELSIREGRRKEEIGNADKFDDQEFELLKFEAQQQGLDERAATAAALRQMGFDVQQNRIDLEKWKLENITKPDTDSKIAKRQADIQAARDTLARLTEKDRASLAIQTSKLKAEFGRLSDAQKRTIIMERALGISGFNAETGRYNAELRKWEGTLKSLGLGDKDDSLWESLVGMEMAGEAPQIGQIHLPDVPGGGTGMIGQPEPDLQGNITPQGTKLKSKIRQKVGAAAGAVAGILGMGKKTDSAASLKPQAGSNYTNQANEAKANIARFEAIIADAKAKGNKNVENQAIKAIQKIKADFKRIFGVEPK